jgi:hypothetical protein
MDDGAAATGLPRLPAATQHRRARRLHLVRIARHLAANEYNMLDY